MSNDNQNSSNSLRIKSLIEKIKQDGAIDDQEVKLLKDAILSDCKVSDEDAYLLFELEDLLKEKGSCKDFEELFVGAITSYLLNSGDSPGHLDVKEWVWLQDRISDDHKYSPEEHALLMNIALKAESLPPNFYEWVNHLERHLDDFGGDLDTLDYKDRTSFLAELKSILKRFH